MFDRFFCFLRARLTRKVFPAPRPWLALCLALLVSAGMARAQFGLPVLSAESLSAVVQTEQVRAELMAYVPEGVAPGKPVWVGLQIAHQPEWHTYWKNAGDSGLPTRLEWTLPAGIRAAEIEWPAPQKINIGRLSNFGYEGTVLLPVPLTIGPDFAPAASAEFLEVKLTAFWLVCKLECVPQDGSFVLQIPLRGSTALHREKFERARAAQPVALNGTSEVNLEPQQLTLTVQGLPAAWRGKNINAFIESTDIIETARSPAASDTQAQNWASDGSWSAALPYSGLRTQSPQTLAFVLSLGAQSLRTEAPVRGTWPPLPTGPAEISPPMLTSAGPLLAPLTPLDTGLGSWALALAAALLGGLILNLMPCVFPVLAIKVLGLAKPGQEHISHRAQGLAFTAGVVLSFLALGGLMLALRAGGEQLGWGFQLQSPAVIAALALLFTLIGLNLWGQLDVGNLLPGNLASVQLRHPLGDAFLSGVLAVAIASPCTAPFMGASLGYAIALPSAQALGIFAALGLGLALPFLAISWMPGLARLLPRPGAWMETLRRFLAFPMWATVVWLIWVLGHLSGIDGAASLLALLLSVTFLVWSLNQTGRSRLVFSAFALLLSLWLAASMGPQVLKEERSSSSTLAHGWQKWEPGLVERELAAGKPVFVDFTAAWCITCQYNKTVTFSNPEVIADFAAKRVSLLRADWTHRDPLITQALNRLGRSGVPVYVLYQAGQAPLVMSEILDADDLRQTLARL